MVDSSSSSSNTGHPLSFPPTLPVPVIYIRVNFREHFFRQSLKKRTPRDFHFVSHKTQKHTAVLNYFAAQSVSLYNYNESDKEQLCDDFVLSLWNDQY